MGNLINFDNCPEQKSLILDCFWKKYFWVAQEDKLPSLNVNPDSITFSGFDTGATFAHHFHIVYPSIVKGVGLVQGLPYMISSFDGVERTAETYTAFSEKMVSF